MLDDRAVSSRANDPIAFPGTIKTFVFGSPNVRRKFAQFAPTDLSVVLNAPPNVAGDLVDRPLLIIEATGVPGYPEFPEDNTAQERPNWGKLTKTSGESLSKYAVVPVEVEVSDGVARAAL